MNRSMRLYAIIAAVVVVLGAGLFVTVKLVTSSVNDSVTQGDLFGSDNPSPSGTATTPTPSASPTTAGKDIGAGALNFLIVGVDTRTYVKNWTPHADAVMILHVAADHTHAYLTSLPRDLVVDIPAFGPAGFSGERSKLTHSMSFGSRVPGKATPNPTQGFQLVARTVSAYTGISRWDGGALLTFQGLKNIVDTLGGIDLYVDQKVVSIHLQPNGAPRPSCPSCDHGYSGPQATYNVGNRHLTGWQALDYSRQRYLPGAAYTRDRHQRQVVRAIIAKILKTNFMTDPLALATMFRRLGSNLIFDGRGHTPIDIAFTLRKVSPATMTLVGLPGAGAYSGGSYIGENLAAIEAPFFKALVADQLPAFLKAHPGLVNAR